MLDAVGITTADMELMKTEKYMDYLAEIEFSDGTNASVRGKNKKKIQSAIRAGFRGMKTDARKFIHSQTAQ